MYIIKLYSNIIIVVCFCAQVVAFDFIIITVLLGDRGLLYVSTDKKGRQYQIWYRPMTPQGNGETAFDKLLLQTDLKYSSLNMSLSRDKQFVIITNSTRLSTEVCNHNCKLIIINVIVIGTEPLTSHLNGDFSYNIMSRYDCSVNCLNKWLMK